MQLAPPGRRQRPGVRVAPRRRAPLTDRQPHRRNAVHPVLLPLEEAVEEAQLQVLAPVGVERIDVGARVDHEPLVRGRRAEPALDVAPEVQVQGAPVPGGQQRDLDPAQIGAARLVVGVEQRVLRELLAPVGTGGAVALRLDLQPPPELDEAARVQATLTRRLAVEVRQALPRDHRGQMRRLQRGDAPGHHRVPGDAARRDLARRPGLRRRPFDDVVEVLGVLRAEEVEVAGRLAGAAGVRAHERVATRDPPVGVRRLPHHVLALLDELVEREALGPVEVLAVRADTCDDRDGLVAVGAEHVHGDRRAVARRDGDVALDPHRDYARAGPSPRSGRS